MVKVLLVVDAHRSLMVDDASCQQSTTTNHCTVCWAVADMSPGKIIVSLKPFSGQM